MSKRHSSLRQLDPSKVKVPIAKSESRMLCDHLLQVPMLYDKAIKRPTQFFSPADNTRVLNSFVSAWLPLFTWEACCNELFKLALYKELCSLKSA